MEIYKTVDGDRIDLICFAYYGTCEAVPMVLEKNPYLAEHEVFPAGLEIVLPDIEVNLFNRPRLWDEA
jgi:phage tail protein X